MEKLKAVFLFFTTDHSNIDSPAFIRELRERLEALTTIGTGSVNVCSGTSQDHKKIAEAVIGQGIPKNNPVTLRISPSLDGRKLRDDLTIYHERANRDDYLVLVGSLTFGVAYIKQLIADRIVGSVFDLNTVLNDNNFGGQLFTLVLRLDSKSLHQLTNPAEWGRRVIQHTSSNPADTAWMAAYLPRSR